MIDQRGLKHGRGTAAGAARPEILLAKRRSAVVLPTRIPTLALGLAALAYSPTIARSQQTQTIDTGSADVMHGWRVFHEKQCADCHAIWTLGGSAGPDFGRIGSGRLSDAQLAGIMWNHIPKMLGRMNQTGHRPIVLSRVDTEDLFALIRFVRQLDELGDPVRGRNILRVKGCGACHATENAADSVGPDLAKWGKYVNPIVWAQMMWEHAPMMEEAMNRAGIEWPKLEGADLAHIVAYVRSIGLNEEKSYLRPGSPTEGRVQFTHKKCNLCHPGRGPDLASADLPNSVGALASRMWNHSPAMTRVMGEQDVARLPISPQELADILSYILVLSNQDRVGEPERGARVFARKGCVQCHEREEVSAVGAPPVEQLRGHAAPINMAAAMWNHGATMLERMTEAGISWPVFRGTDMNDLLAYLRGVQTESDGDGAPGR